MARREQVRINTQATECLKDELGDKLAQTRAGCARVESDRLSADSTGRWLNGDGDLPVDVAKELVTSFFVAEVIDAPKLAHLLDVIADGSPPSDEPAVLAPRVICGDQMPAILRRIDERIDERRPRFTAKQMRVVKEIVAIFAEEVRRGLEHRPGGPADAYEIVPKPEIAELDARLSTMGKAYDLWRRK